MDLSALNAFNNLVLSVLIMNGMAATPPRPGISAPVQIDRCGHQVVSTWNTLNDPTCPPLPPPPPTVEETPPAATYESVMTDLNVSAWKRRPARNEVAR